MKRSKKRQMVLNGRIAEWENTMKGSSDIFRKHPKGFRKPGSTKK